MIERVIKEASSEQLATHLLTELIRVVICLIIRFEAKIGEIETILEKYKYIYETKFLRTCRQPCHLKLI